MGEIVYKVVDADEWREAEAAGIYRGSPDDERDGFIHFSTTDQLPGTLAKHFAGQDGLVLVALEAAALGDKLVWEPARQGALFPHLYGPLPTSAALWTAPITLGPDGVHALPADLASQTGEALS